ncbi:MAG: DUF3102 domain-containing protein [Chroococcidiopsidaceae cyanobacterium CP_BM_RX_35]|nr:DUF3102 domain-containing protein [Chroococcidiopsidaceae cyanobacterium CP_BM_RX_35]
MPTSDRSLARKEFDYSSLDPEISEFVQQQAGEIKVLVKRTAQGIIEVGLKLVNIKERLGHGQFGDWLEAEFDWTDRTARQFMRVAEEFKSANFSDLPFSPSALYLLAAPSSPQAAKLEAISRAEAGEFITYTKAKDLKQKYALPSKSKPKRLLKLEPKLNTELVPPIISTLVLPPQQSTKQEIVAIRPLPPASAISAVPTSVQPGIWWQLGGKHLLYCGDPNSDKFLEQVTEEVQLLLAFPPVRDWLPAVRARTRIIADEYLPQGKDIRLFEDTLETNVLLYSNLEDLVISCFLPSLEILSIINRLDRRGLLAEPDSRRCSAIVADWKRAGLKAERESR